MVRVVLRLRELKVVLLLSRFLIFLLWLSSVIVCGSSWWLRVLRVRCLLVWLNSL